LHEYKFITVVHHDALSKEIGILLLQVNKICTRSRFQEK